MAEIKTKTRTRTNTETTTTKETIAAYLAKISDDERRKDCKALINIMKGATRQQPTLDRGIVGFGKYHYKYDSGHEGDSCLVGFSSRKPDISIYLFPVFPKKDALLEKLGKHRMGKGCLYIRRLADVDTGVLEKMVVASITEVKRRYVK
jgi:hypothetical protein